MTSSRRGGLNNVTLAIGTRTRCARRSTLIERWGGKGGLHPGASAIMQNDTRPENMQALVEAPANTGI
jgi:hypothetical protein